MTFKLQPGDYIATSDVPEDKRQAVIDAFVAAGAKCDDEWSPRAEDFPAWKYFIFDHHPDDGLVANLGREEFLRIHGLRRVTLSQILGEQSPSWDDVGPELLLSLKRMVYAYPYSPVSTNWRPKKLAHDKAKDIIAKAKELMK